MLQAAREKTLSRVLKALCSDIWRQRPALDGTVTFASYRTSEGLWLYEGSANDPHASV
jgi:hypothetical protein